MKKYNDISQNEVDKEIKKLATRLKELRKEKGYKSHENFAFDQFWGEADVLAPYLQLIVNDCCVLGTAGQEVDFSAAPALLPTLAVLLLLPIFYV